MAKNNKWKKKKRSKTQCNNSSKLIISQIVNPFQDISLEIQEQILEEITLELKKQFSEVLELLRDNINQINPLQLLSILSFYGLTEGLNNQGKREKKDNEGHIQQCDVEIIQALILQIPSNKIADEVTKPHLVQNIFNSLPQLRYSFPLKRIEEIKKIKNEEEKSILTFQEQLRNHTQFVRNWGYSERVIKISERLYHPLDNLYKKNIGLEATKLIYIFEYLVKGIERQVTQLSNDIKEVISQKNIQDMMDKFYEKFSQIEGKKEELINLCEKQNFSIENLKSIIINYCDSRFLISIYTLSCEEISNDLNIDVENIKMAFSKLSYTFGDLAEENSEHFFLSNPIWTKPLIQISDDLYFCSMPQIFFSFIFPIFRELITDDEDKLFDQKATFLEKEIKEIVKNSFPDGILHDQLEWQEQKQQYETDLICKIDSYLLIFEAKSGSISAPAFRGATSAMKRDIRKLLEEPAIQSQRLSKKIWRIKNIVEQNQQLTQEDQELVSNLDFDLSEIKKIIRLSITLEDFATIQSNILPLQKTGWLSKDFSPCVTMTLADLEIVFDILETQPDKIHYLIWRTETQENWTYLGDELDLLGVYLEPNFNLNYSELNQNQWICHGMSEKIDDYYIAKENNFSPSKPKLKLSKWWKDIRDYIGERKPNRWTDVAVMMLNVSYQDQLQLEQELNKVVRHLKKNKYQENENHSIIFIPNCQPNESFGLVAIRDFQEKDRRNIMQSVATRAFEMDKVERCLVIGVCISSSDYPYSTLAIYEKNHK